MCILKFKVLQRERPNNGQIRLIILQLVESLQLREQSTRRNSINLIFHCTVMINIITVVTL